jgi:hypothetical protein
MFDPGDGGETARASDQYINATAMCKATGKLWGNYWQNQQTQEFVEALSGSIGIPIHLLSEGITTGPNDRRGTWVHRRIAIGVVEQFKDCPTVGQTFDATSLYLLSADSCLERSNPSRDGNHCLEVK